METLAEVRSRLPEGTVKRVLFDALQEAGPAGLNVPSLVDAVQVPLFLQITKPYLRQSQNFTCQLIAPHT